MVDVRRFNGTSDVITLSIGTLGTLTGALTMAAIVNRTKSDYAAVIDISTGTTQRVGLEGSNSATLDYIAGSYFPNGPIAWPTTDGWDVIGYCKASGTAAPRAHKYRYSTGVWTHTNNGSNAGNPTAGNTVRIGDMAGLNEKFGGDIAIIGIWKRQLSDVEFETLESGLQAWVDLTPDALWRLDQASTATPVNDLTGNGANQTAISGTTVVSGVEPPGFDWTLGGSANQGTLVGVVPRPTGSLVGTSEAAAALAGLVPKPVGSLAGAGEASGTIAAAVPRPIGTLVGSGEGSATILGVVPRPVGALAGTGEVVGTVSGAVPRPVGNLTGAAEDTGTLAGIIPVPVGTLVSVAEAVGSVTGTLPRPVGSLVATATTEGTLAAIVPAPIGTLTTSTVIAGQLQGKVPQPTGLLVGVGSGDGLLAGQVPMPRGSLEANALAGIELVGTVPRPVGELAGGSTAQAGLIGTVPAPIGSLVGAGPAAPFVGVPRIDDALVPPPFLVSKPLTVSSVVVTDLGDSSNLVVD